MAERKKTFDEDLFHRKPYAEFLKNLILNSDFYHRDDDVKAYTIAIDSPWGTGKSVFLEKFESLLETECKDALRVVHYNAWKNDFWNNAFEPFAEAVFSDPLFAAPLGDQKSEQAIKKIGSAAKHLVLAFAKKGLENYFDADQMTKAAEAASGAVGAYTSNESNAISPAYSSFKQNLKDMQEGMRAVLETLNGGKLVIVIDELDRCRPTFAVETLEIVKHIMDVENVVYIFALDVKQLGAAIRQVYGADTDATGYLMRFFSYYSRMPEASNKSMIIGIVQKFFADGKAMEGDSNKLIDNMTTVSEALDLSARDLETIGKVYSMMLVSFLLKYRNSRAYLLYWFLLCTKYKDPVLFNAWIGDKERTIRFPYEDGSRRKMPEQVTEAVQKIDEAELIGNLKLFVRENSEIEDFQGEERGLSFADKANNGKIIVCYTPNSQFDVRGQCSLSVKGDLSGVLFYRDLLKKDKINGYTLKQYYSKQMEMFDILKDK